MLHQECDNALKVFLECFPLVESAISAPETARRIRCSQDVYGTVIGVLGLKMVTNGHFSFLSESPSAMEENFDLKN